MLYTRIDIRLCVSACVCLCVFRKNALTYIITSDRGYDKETQRHSVELNLFFFFFNCYMHSKTADIEAVMSS